MPAMPHCVCRLEVACNAELQRCTVVCLHPKRYAAGRKLPHVTGSAADALHCCCAARWLSFVFALITCLNKATLVANTVAADPFIQARV